MKRYKHQFVETIPERLDPDILYISVEYKTITHLCPCGCGEEVAIPISPYDWEIMFNGESVSLYPSIGNWGLPCRSHYWIKNNEVVWAPKWSTKKVIEARKKHSEKRGNFYRDLNTKKDSDAFWQKLKTWWK